MTKIIVYKSNHKYSGFKCFGHSGYAEYSKDIVCASISVLVINTINSIDQLTDDVIEVDSDEKNGLIKCNFKNLISSNSCLLLDAMILGLTEIQKQYGKTYIDLKFEEV